MPVIKAKHIISILLAVVLVYLVAFLIFPKPLEGSGEFGTFGDFVGGMLNPLLSFASVMAIVYTISLQREEVRLAIMNQKTSEIRAKEELNHFQQEAELSEITRLLKANELDLDKILVKTVRIITEDAKNTYDGRFEQYVNWVNMNFKFDKARTYGSTLRENQFGSRIFIWVGENLIFINDYLIGYNKIKPDSLLIRHYQYKYMRLARSMYFLGYIEREDVSLLLTDENVDTEPLDPLLM